MDMRRKKGPKPLGPSSTVRSMLEGTWDPPLGGQIDVEPFSSLGGDLPFYFDGSGNPLADSPVTRFKPEIAGPDGSNTTFFGTDIAFDPDSHPNFFGTSAAAPHAAGVAALVLEASSSLEPNGVNQVVESSARDIETAGVDNLSGYGLIDAWNAVQTVSPTGSDCIDDLRLSNQVVNGTQFFRACNEISAAHNYRVSASGNLTFRAGERITLGRGFSIERGGAFSAQLHSSM